MHLLIGPAVLFAQPRFSVATTASLLRNMDNAHPFTTYGQTLQFQMHVSEKSTVYAWFSYYAHGKYKRSMQATARLPLTQPQSFSFTNRGDMQLRGISFGYKRFLRGAFNKANNLNIYMSAGFGLILGTVKNRYSVPVDTAAYTVENHLREGSGNFKRLTTDLTAGGEYNVATGIFFFSEFMIMIPTSDYPYDLLLKNNSSPLPVSLNAGFRVLF